MSNAARKNSSRLLPGHLEEIEPPAEKRTLEELAHWFAEQRQRIEILPLDERVKDAHLAELNARYAELSSKLLESLQP